MRPDDLVNSMLEDDSKGFTIQSELVALLVGPFREEAQNTYTEIVSDVTGSVDGTPIKGIFRYKNDTRDPHGSFEFVEPISFNDNDDLVGEVTFLIDEDPRTLSALRQFGL